MPSLGLFVLIHKQEKLNKIKNGKKKKKKKLKPHHLSRSIIMVGQSKIRSISHFLFIYLFIVFFVPRLFQGF